MADKSPKAGSPQGKKTTGGGGRKRLDQFSKFYTKCVSKIGIVEKTNYDEKFRDGIDQVEHYRCCVDELLTGIELILQPNEKIMNTPGSMGLPPPGELPWEVVAKAAARLHCQAVQRGDKKEGFLWLMLLGNRLSTLERDSYQRIRRSVVRLRRFVTIDHEAMKQMRDNMETQLGLIDEKRHEVKMAKAPEDLEASGRAYQKAIRDFDQQAQDIQTVIDSLPELKYAHQRETVKFFDQQAHYHRVMATAIQETIKELERSGLQTDPRAAETKVAASKRK